MQVPFPKYYSKKPHYCIGEEYGTGFLQGARIPAVQFKMYFEIARKDKYMKVV